MHESNNYFNDQILKKTVLYPICNKLVIICKLLLISMLQLKLSFLKFFKIKTQKFFYLLDLRGEFNSY